MKSGILLVSDYVLFPLFAHTDSSQVGQFAVHLWFSVGSVLFFINPGDDMLRRRDFNVHISNLCLPKIEMGMKMTMLKRNNLFKTVQKTLKRM